MSAKIIITMSEDGKTFQSQVQGNMLDVAMLLLSTMDQEKLFATAAMTAVEQYIENDEKQKRADSAITNKKPKYHA
jgi:hypothetical protein